MKKAYAWLFGLVIVFGLARLDGQTKALHALSGTQRDSSKAKLTGMEMPMPLVAPLFLENGGYRSSVTMVNELTTAVHGTIVARNSEGAELGRKVITFAAHSRTVLPLSDLISGADETPIIGSLELTPDPMEVTSMAIAAQLSIVNNRTAPTTYWEEEFISMDPRVASSYRAVVPSAFGSPLVALFNTAMSPQQVTIKCFTERAGFVPEPITVSLGPKQMSMVRACNVRNQSLSTDNLSTDNGRSELDVSTIGAEGKPRPVGLEVSGTGASGSLATWGIATVGEERRTRIALNFSNWPSLHSRDTVFPGVPIGPADLLPGDTFTADLAVANFGSGPADVTVSYNSIVGDAPQRRTIASLSLSAGVVKHVPLHDVTGDPTLRNSFVVTSSAAAGTVISNLILRGQKLYPAVQLIGKDPEVNNGGGHPWSIADRDESTLFLFNLSEKPQLFNVNISVNGLNKQWHQEYTLQPAETRHVSIGDLVRSHAKDLSGDVLPAAAQAGEISWFTIQAGKGTGRLLVSNSLTGLARNFSCGYNIVMCGAFLSPSTATFAVGTTGTLGPIQANTCTAYNPTACSGQPYGTGGGVSYNWQSLNTSIATISGSDTNPSGTFLGQSPGTATGQGDISNGAGCSFVSDGTLNVLNACFAQLKYRPVTFGGVNVGNHSFWWIQKNSGSLSEHYVIDGGPSGPCTPNCGTLLDWVTYGDTGHYSADNPSASLAWSSGVSGGVCTQVQNLFNYGIGWPQTQYNYQLYGPNSNTFAHLAGNAAPFNPTAPPNAPGW